MFLTSAEVREMRRDFARLLRSPEATTVTFRYYAEAVPGATTPVVDEVYKNHNNLTASNTPVEEEFKCVHHVMDVQSLEKYPGGFMREGECIFYLQWDLNLEEPKEGFPVIFESLTLVDALDIIWRPKLVGGKLASFHHLFRIGQYQIATAIACRPEK